MKYVIFFNSSVYHKTIDSDTTACAVPIVVSDIYDTYQGGYPLPIIVDEIPDGLRLCKKCLEIETPLNLA